MSMPKFIDSREAIAVWQCATLGGDALMSYLRRARESYLQNLLVETGEGTVRMQGAVKALDELIKKMIEARGIAEKKDTQERQRGVK